MVISVLTTKTHMPRTRPTGRQYTGTFKKMLPVSTGDDNVLSSKVLYLKRTMLFWTKTHYKWTQDKTNAFFKEICMGSKRCTCDGDLSQEFFCRRQFSKTNCGHKKTTIATKFLSWVRHTVPDPWQKFPCYCGLFVYVVGYWKLTSTKNSRDRS